MFDQKTGKPRGYGFCEYHDVETAKSAIRNLNDRDLNGRQLRVDFADNNDSNDDDAPPPSSRSLYDVCFFFFCFVLFFCFFVFFFFFGQKNYFLI